jgi:NAD(P)-dependent dehydrogenase (short-subunit alcohol dehydrogenase family)
MDGCLGTLTGGESLLGSFPGGFALSLQRELPQCTFQILDAGSRSWAEALGDHLDVVSDRVLTGWRDGRRVTVDHVPAPVAGRAARVLKRGDLVLVTGGARGIVFECVRALARETGCRLLLTGRTPPADGDPDWLRADAGRIDAVLRAREVELARSGRMGIGEARRMGHRMRSQWEIHANLGKLAEDGIEASYEQCDVSAVDELRKLVRRLKKRGEPVRGVVHGAGVQRAALLEDLGDEQLISTLNTKLVPVLVMAEALDWDDLALFVSFGSVTGAFGNAGQTDYGLANFILTGAGRVLAARHPRVRATTIEWTAWEGTGMVTDREIDNFKALGLTILDRAHGIELFLDAVLSRKPLSQVSVFNPGSAFSLRPSQARKPRSGLLEEGGLTACFSPERDAFLGQHLLNGQPVVPGTFVIEMFAEASSSTHPVGLEEVNFRRPMWIRRENHGVEVVMEGASLRALPEQRPDVPARALSNLQYASARMADPVGRIESVPMATDAEIAALEASSGNGGARRFYDLLDERFAESLATGPIFRGLLATVATADRCVGLVELTPEALQQFNGAGLLFNPITSDMAVQVASSWAMERLGVMAIPASVERVELHATLEGTRAVVCCRLVSMDEDRTVVDLTIYGKDGRKFYDMDKLVLRSIARITG